VISTATPYEERSDCHNELRGEAWCHPGMTNRGAPNVGASAAAPGRGRRVYALDMVAAAEPARGRQLHALVRQPVSHGLNVTA